MKELEKLLILAFWLALVPYFLLRMIMHWGRPPEMPSRRQWHPEHKWPRLRRVK